MNYDDHLKQWQDKQRQLEESHEEQARRREIALRECFREADAIIREAIQPEFEALRAALVAAGFPSRVTMTRETSELDQDSTFNVGIELRENQEDDAPKRGIVFTALPNQKVFRVTLHTSLDRSARPTPQEMKFVETDAAAVKEICARFLLAAFVIN